MIGLVVGMTGCGSTSKSDGAHRDGGSGGASMNVPDDGGGNPGSGGEAGGGGAVTEDGGTAVTSTCDAFGRYGKATKVFTLPSGAGIYYPDVQKSFPDVDWKNIDRLYVPAGKYEEFNLGNLPVRDAAHPLVITNSGGQVQVGPNPGANYIWSMAGGAHWILTGRYDADSATGDVAFPGHRCGAYAGSRGKYGFLSDDGFDTTGADLHMGIAVGSATDFAIEYTEVMRSGFAGIRLLNARKAGDPAFDMANVEIHDNYIHDTAAEGTYFGWTGDPPANLLPGLRVYNNRIVRTGNEALQIQDLGDGTEIYDNVIAFAALHFRDNGLGKYQDNNAQVQTRQGTIALHDNVFLGGAGTVLSFWSQPEDGDGARHVTFTHNYFGAAKSLMAYLGGDAAAGSDFHFVDNFFTGMTFSYDELDPAVKDPGVVFQLGGYDAPVDFTSNHWDGKNALVSGIKGGDGTVGMVTATSNVDGTITPLEFAASGYPDGTPIQKLELWGTQATLSPGMPAITYQPGDLVMFDAEMYQCTTANTGKEPSSHPESWKHLPTPADDFRVKSASVYKSLGVH